LKRVYPAPSYLRQIREEAEKVICSDLEQGLLGKGRGQSYALACGRRKITREIKGE